MTFPVINPRECVFYYLLSSLSPFHTHHSVEVRASLTQPLIGNHQNCSRLETISHLVALPVHQVTRLWLVGRPEL
jgi:hypothetical protein